MQLVEDTTEVESLAGDGYIYILQLYILIVSMALMRWGFCIWSFRGFFIYSYYFGQFFKFQM